MQQEPTYTPCRFACWSQEVYDDEYTQRDFQFIIEMMPKFHEYLTTMHEQETGRWQRTGQQHVGV